MIRPAANHAAKAQRLLFSNWDLLLVDKAADAFDALLTIRGAALGAHHQRLNLIDVGDAALRWLQFDRDRKQLSVGVLEAFRNIVVRIANLQRRPTRGPTQCAASD
jgi:hypothetical protein